MKYSFMDNNPEKEKMGKQERIEKRAKREKEII